MAPEGPEDGLEKARTTLHEGIERYLACVELEKGLSKRTQESYGSDLEQFAHHAATKGLKDWKSLGMTELSSYLAVLASQNLSTASVARKITSIRNFLRYLFKEGLQENDFSERIDVPRLRRKLPQTMSEKQFEQLLGVILTSTPEGMRDRAIIEVLFGCGLRVSELISLRITDISDNFDFVKVFGKGSKERMVPVGGKAAEAVKAYLTQARPQLVSDKTDSTLFISRRGTPLSRKTIWFELKQYAAKAQLPINLKPHLLRHSFATELLHGGADLRLIQEMLGHADIATTQIYASVETSGLTATHEKCHPRAHLKWADSGRAE